MQHDLRKYLADIHQALEELTEFRGQTLADYQAAGLARRGVEREFIIIGEAIARMVHRFPETRTASITHAASPTFATFSFMSMAKSTTPSFGTYSLVPSPCCANRSMRG
jgi:hypothetical protein